MVVVEGRGGGQKEGGGLAATGNQPADSSSMSSNIIVSLRPPKAKEVRVNSKTRLSRPYTYCVITHPRLCKAVKNRKSTPSDTERSDTRRLKKYITLKHILCVGPHYHYLNLSSSPELLSLASSY